MTHNEFREKYPIGTKIKFVIGSLTPSEACKRDTGKVGKIVGYTLGWECFPIIYLPESKHTSCYSTPLIPASWQTTWKSLEVLPQKNQQLLFDFALEDV